MGSARAFILALLGFVVLHGWLLHSAQAAVHNYTFIVSVCIMFICDVPQHRFVSA